MFIVLDCRNCLKVGVVLIPIKLNTHLQYVLKTKMYIPTTKEILLFRLMLCAIVLFFGATYVITLFIDSFFCASNICSDSLKNIMFETVKESVLGDCIAGCRFVYS